jgi:hypothetical protein
VAHKFRWGDTRASPRSCKLASIALVLAFVAGCGDGGVADDATATVYVAAVACNQAERALEDEGGGVGSLRLRIVCVPAVERAGRFDLAQIGANARRAVEDSAAIAYIGEVEPHANRFAAPILEEAGIAQLPNMSGSKAMRKLFPAIEEALDADRSLRESVDDALR